MQFLTVKTTPILIKVTTEVPPMQHKTLDVHKDKAPFYNLTFIMFSLSFSESKKLLRQKLDNFCALFECNLSHQMALDHIRLILASDLKGSVLIAQAFSTKSLKKCVFQLTAKNCIVVLM